MSEAVNRILRPAAGLALAGLAAVAVMPVGASAHGLVVRQDLPIPEWLFIYGASLVLIVSFVVLSVAWREPRLQETRWRAYGERVSAALIGPAPQLLAGLIGVVLLVAVIYSGLSGTPAPDRNFSVTFVFVTFWLGMVVLSVLLGDIFRAFNPWRAIARAFALVFKLVSGGQSVTPPLAYPERFGHWPAVAGLVAFAWLELVYPPAGSSGISPNAIGVATIIYSSLTFVAMALYGIEAWVWRGETFSVYMRMFAGLAPLEVRDGRLGRRKALAGAVPWGAVPGSLAVVVLAIAATSFDGGQEGLLKTPIEETFNLCVDIGFSNLTAARIGGSIWFAVSVLAVFAIYRLGIWGMQSVSGAPSRQVLHRSFTHTLIPIALAYLVAHYFSLVVFQEQAQFTFLLSDPLGDGSDLFGTAGSGIDFGVIGANAVWYTQVGALIVGHVVALALAHDRAIALFKDYRKASQSQYWMLGVMVIFTTLGLFLLSQANA